jgi:hypothetical protein
VASSPSLPFTNVLSTSTTSANVAAGSVANTLADVAEYYYRNDLRGT